MEQATIIWRDLAKCSFHFTVRGIAALGKISRSPCAVDAVGVGCRKKAYKTNSKKRC